MEPAVARVVPPLRHPIAWLDTGDSFALILAEPNVVQSITAMYRELDVSVEVLPTDHVATGEEFQAVCDVCTRVIPADRPDVKDRLVQDVGLVLRYEKTKRWWGSWLSPTWCREGVLSPKPSPGGGGRGHEGGVTTDHVVYNASIEVALVLQGVTAHLQRVCELCPDFSVEAIVTSRNSKDDTSIKPYSPFDCTLRCIDHCAASTAVQDAEKQQTQPLLISCDANKSVLRDMFHRRTYSKQVLQKKLAGLVALYESPQAEAVLDPHAEERRAVRAHMKTLYKLNRDEAQRMRASELYHCLGDLMCVPRPEAGRFNRRVAGYLLELGLTKKRFSDGYHYFGVSPIYLDPPQSGRGNVAASILDPQAIEAQRSKEQADWGKDEQPMDWTCAPCADLTNITVVDQSWDAEGVVCIQDLLAPNPLARASINTTNGTLRFMSHDLRAPHARQLLEQLHVRPASSLNLQDGILL